MTLFQPRISNLYPSASPSPHLSITAPAECAASSLLKTNGLYLHAFNVNILPSSGLSAKGRPQRAAGNAGDRGNYPSKGVREEEREARWDERLVLHLPLWERHKHRHFSDSASSDFHTTCLFAVICPSHPLRLQVSDSSVSPQKHLSSLGHPVRAQTALLPPMYNSHLALNPFPFFD